MHSEQSPKKTSSALTIGLRCLLNEPRPACRPDARSFLVKKHQAGVAVTPYTDPDLTKSIKMKAQHISELEGRIQ